MGPCELTVGVTAIANAIAKDLTTKEVALVSSIFMQLGDTLSTIAAQRDLFESLSQDRDNKNELSDNLDRKSDETKRSDARRNMRR